MITMCPIMCFSVDLASLIKWLFSLNIKTLLESDVFMGACSFLSLLVAAVGLFFINKNVISVQKSISNNVVVYGDHAQIEIDKKVIGELKISTSLPKNIWKN